jgi:hypothetical protein
MLSTIAGTLDHAVPDPPPALLAPRAYARVRAVMARLPASLAHWLYLECRLAPGPPGERVDVIVGVGAAEGGAQVLSGLAVCHPIWRRLVAFARHWRRTGSHWERSIARLWLEFDAGAFVPSVFVEPFSDAGDAFWASIATDSRLRLCLDRLPAGARIAYIGFFPARGIPDIRLSLTGVPDAGLTTYLDAIGWRGDGTQLAGELDRVGAAHASGVGIVNVDIDPRGGVSDRIGLEYVCERGPQARRAFAEGALLDLLVSRGLCTSARREALARWPRSSYAVMPHELWESVLHRRVNHIKLTFDAGHVREAKAYLAIGYHPRRRSSIE